MQPLAIIGVANRFPGSGNSPAEFWNNLVNRKDCISEAKMDRWNARYYSSKGTLYRVSSLSSFGNVKKP